ncbi:MULTISPECIES: hypothetical protein [unclassified Haladaptatus]|uniref:hypothetical protein n=1 Tax=unclassified Haladaptatus TaxID=2622732 RepID=UPI0023E80727|nr:MULTISPECIES: hypothetical protein [unclassified Haladaptatus]
MGVTVLAAERRHVDGICRVCADGWRATYTGILPEREIEATIEEFYTPERVAREVRSPEDWDGWLVALEDGGGRRRGWRWSHCPDRR